MIFVDTSAWYAFAVPNDPNHGKAVEWMATASQPLFTTDYVVGETLTLLRSRRLNDVAISVGDAFFSGEAAEVHFLTPDEILDAWHVFRDFRDKAWSFTDATSKVVIEKLGIRRAFAFDQHFEQFGSVELVPAQ